MKLGRTIQLGALAVGGFALPALGISADAAGNPYQPIVERNTFGLKPPVPVDLAPKPPAPPPALVELSGIATILGKKQAFLQVQEPARPNEPAKKLFLTLSEGERQGEIEVLQIDPVAGVVKVSNAGVVTNLDIQNNAPKLASTPPVQPAGPGSPGAPKLGAPPPAPVPAPAAAPAGVLNPAGGTRTIPTTVPSRTIRTSATGSGGLGIVTGVAAHAPSVSAGGGAAAHPPAQPVLTPEEQTLLIELERERTREQVRQGLLPPLPPTELTPPSSMPPVLPPSRATQ